MKDILRTRKNKRNTEIIIIFAWVVFRPPSPSVSRLIAQGLISIGIIIVISEQLIINLNKSNLIGFISFV